MDTLQEYADYKAECEARAEAEGRAERERAEEEAYKDEVKHKLFDMVQNGMISLEEFKKRIIEAFGVPPVKLYGFVPLVIKNLPWKDGDNLIPLLETIKVNIKYE